MNRLARLLLSLATAAPGFAAPPDVAAEPVEVQTRPAREISFKTEAGRFYQLEASSSQAPGGDDAWVSLGDPIKGDGKRRTRLITAGDEATHYRARLPTNQRVRVWADEFEGWVVKDIGTFRRILIIEDLDTEFGGKLPGNKFRLAVEFP